MATTHLELSEIPQRVERNLAAFFDARADAIAAIGEPVAHAVSHLQAFVLGGGKRVRPTYGWAGFAGAGGLERGAEDPDAVLRAVSALELIQACALVHDDIIDASDTRRGNPTVHRALEAEHRDRDLLGSAEAYGTNAAILLGDLALAWAEDMWRYSGVSQEALVRAAEPWVGMRTEVIGGQLLDMMLESLRSESVEMANRVNRYKTAAYTIERPLHLGAALAGADEATINAFRGYGRDVGIAFQLRDDLLGVFGDPAITGKPAGDDLREGKRTELFATAVGLLAETDPDGAEELRTGIGQTADDAKLRRLAQLIRGSGAEDAVEQRIEQLTASGLEYLEDAGINDAAVDALTALAHKATDRRK